MNKRLLTLVFLLFSFSALSEERILSIKKQEDASYLVQYIVVNEDNEPLTNVISVPLHAGTLMKIDPMGLDHEPSDTENLSPEEWMEVVKKWTKHCHVLFPAPDKTYFFNSLDIPEMNIKGRTIDLSEEQINASKLPLANTLIQRECHFELNHEEGRSPEYSFIKAKIYADNILGQREEIENFPFRLNHKIDNLNASKDPNILYYRSNRLFPAKTTIANFTCPAVLGVYGMACPKIIENSRKCEPDDSQASNPCKMSFLDREKAHMEPSQGAICIRKKNLCVNSLFYVEKASKIFIPNVYSGQAQSYNPPFSTEELSFKLIDTNNNHKIFLSDKSNFSYILNSKNSHLVNGGHNLLFELLEGGISAVNLNEAFEEEENKKIFFAPKDFRYPIFEAEPSPTLEESLEVFFNNNLLNGLSLNYSKLNNYLKNRLLEILEEKTIRRIHIENFNIKDTDAAKILEKIVALEGTVEIIVSTGGLNLGNENIIFYKLDQEVKIPSGQEPSTKNYVEQLNFHFDKNREEQKRTVLSKVKDQYRYLSTISTHKGPVTSLSISLDGSKMASASRDKSVKIFDSNGNVLKTLLGHSGEVNTLSMSPDGTKLVSGSDDKTLILWDIATGKKIETLSGHTDLVRSVSFSPDGSKIVSAGRDKTIRIWTVSTGKISKVLSGHAHGVLSVKFSPDGRKIASTSDDSTIKIWDVETGLELKTLSGHTDSVNSVNFSPDGSKLVSGSDDKTVRLWDMLRAN